MSLISNFKPNEVVDGAAIPENTQLTCLVVEAEDKESKDKPGNMMIAATIEVVEDGEWKGNRVWTNFNMINENATAQRIGQSQMKQLCLAIGVTEATDNSELYNKPFRATFGKPREFNGQMQSNIKKYDPVGGTAGVVGGLANKAAADSKPAWSRK